MKISELLYIFLPIKIPFSSNIEAEINGYVESNPVVKIFLFAEFFTSLLFYINLK